jgi:hypothetical protein
LTVTFSSFLSGPSAFTGTGAAHRPFHQADVSAMLVLLLVAILVSVMLLLYQNQLKQGYNTIGYRVPFLYSKVPSPDSKRLGFPPLDRQSK